MPICICFKKSQEGAGLARSGPAVENGSTQARWLQVQEGKHEQKFQTEIGYI